MVNTPFFVPVPVRERFIQKFLLEEKADALGSIPKRPSSTSIAQRPGFSLLNSLIDVFEEAVKQFKEYSALKKLSEFSEELFNRLYEKTMAAYHAIWPHVTQNNVQAKKVVEPVFGQCFWLIKELELGCS